MIIVIQYTRIITGLLQMAFGAYWVYSAISLFIKYRTPGLLFLFMLPDWILGLRVLIGITGITWGFFMVTGKHTLKKGCGRFIMLWIVGQVIEIMVVAF